MNLPNKLTILRIILTFAFMVFLFLGGIGAKVLAALFFLAACITDALDGYIARKNNQVTDFGKLMDPIADKILILSAFLGFVEMGIVPAWMVVIIMFREIAITGLRILALTKNKIIPSEVVGRHKTVWQVLVIFAILLFIIFNEGGAGAFGFWTPGVETFYRHAIYILMLTAVTLTLISGIAYLVKNREVYSNAKTD